MHRTMPRDARLTIESSRADADVEMAFAPVAVSRMATMTFAVVHHVKLMRSKSLFQSLADLRGYACLIGMRQYICPTLC